MKFRIGDIIENGNNSFQKWIVLILAVEEKTYVGYCIKGSTVPKAYTLSVTGVDDNYDLVE